MYKTVERQLKALPDAPGIYLFFDAKKQLMYVGKATSLKQRVRSYFRGKRTPRPIEEMIDDVRSIKHKQTDSVLEAIILEADYIKRHKPKYNVFGKDDKSWNYIVITNEEYPQVHTIRQHEYITQQKELKKRYLHVFGPFPGLNAKETLKILRKLFGFSTCQKYKKNKVRPCLYYQMGECLGVCTGEISPAQYKKQVITPLVAFLRGKKKQVMIDIEKRMSAAAKKQAFEDAARLRNQLARLQRIQDVTLLNSSFFAMPQSKRDVVSRIEGYDISNLGPTGIVGSMVVFDSGGPVKSQYRRFKIRSLNKQSDVGALTEVLERRLKHREWKYPDVFLVDGGKPQVNAAKKVLAQYGVHIPVVGIAKGPARKNNEFLLGLKSVQFVRWVQAHQSLLVRVRDEAHRFAVAYQRKLRTIR